MAPRPCATRLKTAQHQNFRPGSVLALRGMACGVRADSMGRTPAPGRGGGRIGTGAVSDRMRPTPRVVPVAEESCPPARDILLELPALLRPSHSRVVPALGPVEGNRARSPGLLPRPAGEVR